MRKVLITGTSKGLGYELAKYYIDADCLVIGVSRHESVIDEDSYHHFIGDVTSTEIELGLIQYLESLNISSIDIVINNAGSGSYGYHLSDVDPDEVLHQINLHCIGALRVVKATRRYITNSKIVNVTSRLASIIQNQRGDFADKDFSYSYRIAKCAQNMLFLCLSNDPELSGATIISINPGLLRTDSGSSDAKYSAREGALALMSVVNEVNSNGIYHSFGEEALY